MALNGAPKKKLGVDEGNAATAAHTATRMAQSVAAWLTQWSQVSAVILND